MRKKIEGNRYDFIIEGSNDGREYIFQIFSFYKKKQRMSEITNLNFIISELIEPVLNTIDIDNMLSVKQLEGKKLFSKADSLLQNKSWVNYLEKCLDEDRSIGGWNADSSAVKRLFVTS